MEINIVDLLGFTEKPLLSSSFYPFYKQDSGFCPQEERRNLSQDTVFVKYPIREWTSDVSAKAFEIASRSGARYLLSSWGQW